MYIIKILKFFISIFGFLDFAGDILKNVLKDHPYIKSLRLRLNYTYDQKCFKALSFPLNDGIITKKYKFH